MPNIVRRSRPRQPEPRSKRLCDSGTHLTYEERCHIYSLSQHPGYSQRTIASTLKLPRTTVQSTIYAMTGRSTKQQHRKRTHTPGPNSTPATVASNSAIYTPSAPSMIANMRSDTQLPFSPYPISATPTVSSTTLSMPDCYHRQFSQIAAVTYSWNNILSGVEGGLPANNSHYRLANLPIERFDVPGFDAHGSATFRTSPQQRPPTLMPMEPRIIYESTVNSTFSF